jgi:hypothetical protein
VPTQHNRVEHSGSGRTRYARSAESAQLAQLTITNKNKKKIRRALARTLDAAMSAASRVSVAGRKERESEGSFGGEGRPGASQTKIWIAPKLQVHGGPDWRQRSLPGAARLGGAHLPGLAWIRGHHAVGRGQQAETWKPGQVLAGWAISHNPLFAGRSIPDWFSHCQGPAPGSIRVFYRPGDQDEASDPSVEDQSLTRAALAF